MKPVALLRVNVSANSSTPPAEESAVLLLVRRIGALLLVGAALYVWFAKAPEPPAHHHRDAVSAIELRDNANNGLTEGAPQQTVVNGWTTNRYLRLISDQLDANASRQATRDIRPTALLGLGVLGIALLAFTTPGPLLPTLGRPRPNGRAVETASPPPSPPRPQQEVRPVPSARPAAEAAVGPAPTGAPPSDESRDSTRSLEGLPFRLSESRPQPPEHLGEQG